MPARKGDGRNDKSAATGQHSAIAADAGAALQWARGPDFRNAKLIAGMRSNVSFSISCRRSQCRFSMYLPWAASGRHCRRSCPEAL